MSSDPILSDAIRVASIPTPIPAEWSLARINPGKNSRDIVVDDGIRELHCSLNSTGQIQPLGVIDRQEDNLIFGFRRHKAMGLGWEKPVSVLVYPASITPSQVLTINATENLQRVDLTDPEIFRLCNELMNLNPWSQTDLAHQLGKSCSMVTKYLAPNKLIPEGLEAFLAGRLNFTDAYLISRSPDQAETLRIKLGGGNRDAIQRSIRRPTEATPRSSKIKVPLPSGVTAQFVGADLSLDDALEAAQETVRLIKAALAKSYNCKTAQAIWADIAAAQA